jgi:hypothetical protein
MKNIVIGFALVCTPLAFMVGWHWVFPPNPYNPEIYDFARATYETCRVKPELDRTMRCDAYVKFWEGCTGSTCTIDETHKALARLNFSPPPLRLSPAR